MEVSRPTSVQGIVCVPPVTVPIEYSYEANPLRASLNPVQMADMVVRSLVHSWSSLFRPSATEPINGKVMS